MKNTVKITFSAMMSALAVGVMLMSFFPYLTYAIPAIAGLFIMTVVVEINCKWAFCAYLASAVLVFLTAEKESGLLYIVFLGYYPIAKALLEKIGKPALEWVLKMLIFNAAVLFAYFVLAKIFGISTEDMGAFGTWGAVTLLAMGNGVFVLYDIAVSRMAGMYLQLLHPRIKKIFK